MLLKKLAINGNSLNKCNEDSVRRINVSCFTNIVNIVNLVHTTVYRDSSQFTASVATATSSSSASCLSSECWWRCRSQCRLHTCLFTFNNTNCSNSLSIMRVRWLFMVRPAQLKRRSHAALAGSAVFKRINNFFSCGNAAILAVSSPVELMYCGSTSPEVDGALLCVKKLFSSVSDDAWDVRGVRVSTQQLVLFVHCLSMSAV